MDSNTTIELTSEDERRQAEARNVTIEPLHQDITPESEPDSVAVAQHVNGPAIANAPNDIEQDSTLILPAKETVTTPTSGHHVKLATIATLIFIIGITVAVVLYTLI
jgi:hypothetical protein